MLSAPPTVPLEHPLCRRYHTHEQGPRAPVPEACNVAHRTSLIPPDVAVPASKVAAEPAKRQRVGGPTTPLRSRTRARSS